MSQIALLLFAINELPWCTRAQGQPKPQARQRLVHCCHTFRAFGLSRPPSRLSWIWVKPRPRNLNYLLQHCSTFSPLPGPSFRSKYNYSMSFPERSSDHTLLYLIVDFMFKAPHQPTPLLNVVIKSENRVTGRTFWPSSRGGRAECSQPPGFNF